MAKFIDKKEQVFDFQLTPYGKYTLSTGAFKPVYYTFYDGEILYDGKYADRGGNGIQEIQNNIHTRIKENTAYIESLVCFDELETSPPNKSELIRKSTDEMMEELEALVADPLSGVDSGEGWDLLEALARTMLSPDDPLRRGANDFNYFPTDIEVRHEVPRKDIYRFGQPIGNARFDGPSQQSAPAWKFASLQGYISSSTRINSNHQEERIPQLNMSLTYKKRIQKPVGDINPTSVAETIASTPQFADGYVISLVKDDLLGYIEEVNTELLTENFDIEVFQVETVPAVPAVGKIFLTDDADQVDGETIIINDGWTGDEGDAWRTGRIVTFEFDDDGSVTAGNVPVKIDEQSRLLTVENLASAINDSSLNVLAVGPMGGPDPTSIIITGYYVVSLENKVVQRPWQWTNWEITGSTAHGNTRRFYAGFESGSVELETLNRKYFERTDPQVVDGMMMYGTAPDTHMFGNNDPLTLTSASVEYYFDVLTDTQVDQKAACRGSELFNKDSYYIDLDFECDPTKACEDDDEIFYDIYGRITAGDEPEICEPDDE
jgi:hypothetical protein